MKNIASKVGKFFQRIWRWSLKHKALAVAILIVKVLVIVVIGFAIAIYGTKTDNSATRFMANTIPYPAVVVNGQWGLVRESNFINQYLRHFYDASKQSYDENALHSQVLDQMVTEQIVKQKANSNKIKVTSDEVNQSYKDLVEKNGQEEVNKVLHDLYGFSEADFKTLIYNELLKQKLEKSLRDNKQWHEIQVSHLLIKLDAGADQAAQDAARTKAQKYMDEIMAGKPFAEEAKLYSEDTASKDGGGSLGYVSRGQMVKEFEDAVFAKGVKKADVLGPIKTQYGWHVIIIEDIRGDSDYTIWRNLAKVYKLI